MTPLSSNGGKLYKVTTWSAEESKKKEKLVSDINSNIIEAERVMAHSGPRLPNPGNFKKIYKFLKSLFILDKT